MSDTPVTAPPTRLERVKAFIGDLARPFAIYVTSAAAAWATVSLSARVNSPEAAVFIGAVLAGVGAIYWGKSWENAKAGKQAAEVQVARAENPQTDTGELPPSQRINP